MHRRFKFYLSYLLVTLLGFILTVSASVFFTPHASLSQTPVASSSSEWVQQGQASFEAGNFADAIESFQQAVEQYRTEPLKQALVLSYLSLAYQELGKWEESRDAMNAGFSIVPQTSETETVRVRAQLLNSRGQQELALGQAEKALVSWQDAQTLYTQIDSQTGIVGTQVNQGQALAALGRYRKSCNLVLQALSASQVDCSALVSSDRSETSDAVREEASLEEVLAAIETQPIALRIVGLQVLGNTLRVTGKLEESKVLLESSLTLAKTPQMKSSIALSLGNTLQALTDSRLRKSDPAQRDYTAVPLLCFKNADRTNEYREAIDFYRQAAASLSPLTRVQAQLNLIEIQPESNTEYPKFLAELQELPPSRASIYARVKYTLVLTCQEISDSVSVLRTALEQAEEIGDFRAQSVVFGSLGKLYEKQENWDQAKSYTRTAIDIISKISAADSQKDLLYQWHWQLGRILIKEVGKAFAIEHPNFQKASNEYAAAVDTLKKLRKDLVAFKSDVQYDFRDEVEPVYRQYIDLLLRDLQPSQSNLEAARQAIQALQLAELDDFLRNACTTEDVDIGQIQDSKAAIVYAIFLPDRLAVILSRADREQPASQEQKPNNILEFHSTLEPKEGEFKRVLIFLNKTFRNFDTTSGDRGSDNLKKVYQWLIKPFETTLVSEEIKTLVFVLDGGLRSIPIAALKNKDDRYLIEDYSIALAPGLFIKEPQTLTADRLKVLAVGRSDFTTNPPSSSSRSGESWDNLRYVTNELEEIGRTVQTTKLLDDDFTIDNLAKEVDRVAFSVLHIATHGKFDSTTDDTSILAWGDERLGIDRLGQLLQRRTARLRNSLDLLVLSACQTAEGSDRAILGMAGAAIRAGAGSTIASLWNVNDLSTAVLMERFYQELKRKIEQQDTSQKVNKAEALRQAQLALLRCKLSRQDEFTRQCELPNLNNEIDYSNPYFWSAFTLIGNWQ